MAPDSSLPGRPRLLEALMSTLKSADQRAAMAVARQAMKVGWTVDDVRFHLITPALHEVGLRWERGEIGVADEHLASSVCEWLLFGLAGRVRREPATGRRAVVGCSEGELHTLGARMVAHTLAEQGWTVLFLGADTPAPAWSQIVRARRPDVVVMTTTTRTILEDVGPALHGVKASSPGVLTVVGGQAYWSSGAATAADVGADLLVLEAGTLPRQLRQSA